MQLRLFPKFLILLVLISVIPVALIGRVVVQINDESLQFEVQRYHMRLATSLAKQIDERLNSVQSELSVATLALQDPTVGWPQRQYVLGALVDSSPHLAIIAAVTSAGREVMKVYNPTLAVDVEENPGLNSHADRPLFAAFLASGEQEAMVSREGGDTFVNLYIPFQTPAGQNAIFVKIILNDLIETVAAEGRSIGKSGSAFFVDSEGRLLGDFDAGAQAAAGRAIVKAALNGVDAAQEFTDTNGTRWIGASARVGKLGGAVITQQLRDEAYAASSKGKRRALLFVLITIAFAVLAAYLLARSFVNPLLSISRVARDVDLAEGRFPEPVRIRSNDEIQETAETFNEMLEKLKSYAHLQVEKVLIEQKKTDAILFSIEDGLVMTDYQGRVQLLSRRARELIGLQEGVDTNGQPLWKFLSSPELRSAFMDLLTKPEEKKRMEVKIPAPGKDVYFALTSEEVRTPERDESLGIVTVLHDITLEKEIETMKEEFLHSITHDLRNPLTAIRGFIRLFQSGQTGSTNEIQTKMLGTMDKASLRLLTMVNDILDLARLDSGRLALHLDTFHAADVASRVIDLFAPQALGMKVHLKLDVPETLPEIRADSNLIERVFTNLIGNATKFTPEGGTITARIRDEADVLRCDVTDTGEGIPPDYLNKVFDKFRQVEGNYKGGAGLGLTICKRIIEAHGGRIWVESVVGQGASFIFTIPKNVVVPEEEIAA